MPSGALRRRVRNDIYLGSNSRNVRVEVVVEGESSCKIYSYLEGPSDSVRALHMVLRPACFTDLDSLIYVTLCVKMNDWVNDYGCDMPCC